jgi:hypothetical protein
MPSLFELDKRDVDWGGDTYYEWDLTCPFCNGEGYIDDDDEEDYDADAEAQECEQCTRGHIEIMWDTVWATGLHNVSNDMRRRVLSETNCALICDDDGEWFLALTGCGMDLTPSLAAAWMICGFDWLPWDWVQSLTRLGLKYTRSVAGNQADAVLKAMYRSVESAKQQVSYTAEDVSRMGAESEGETC